MDYNNICSICGKFSYLTKPCGCKQTLVYEDYKPFAVAPFVDKEIGYCSICGFKNTKYEKCNCVGKQHTLLPVITPSKEPYGLLDLYEELGKCNWLGTDAGWDRAIDTVRGHIREQLV